MLVLPNLYLLADAWIALIVYSMPHFEDYPYGLANFHYRPECSVLIGGAALVIVGMALKLPSPHGRPLRILAKWGDYAYPIYLLHILAFSLMLTLLPWNSLNDQLHMAIAHGVILALLLVSAAYYQWVECPAYRFCRQRINHWLNPVVPNGSVLQPIYKNQQPR